MDVESIQTIGLVLAAAALPPAIVAWSSGRRHRQDLRRRIVERDEDRQERDAIARSVETARVLLSKNTRITVAAASESNIKLGEIQAQGQEIQAQGQEIQAQGQEIQAQGQEIHAMVNSKLTRVQRIALKALREIVRLNKKQGIETDAETLADLRELEIIESIGEQSAQQGG
jgi:ubiquinone/menaquinone biosynthesis C-methylase UbiE